MATVFMKWLETNPKNYDRGIRLLTLGRLQRINQKILADYVREGERVLEIGCGTGTLALAMARQGAPVTAVDASPRMLAEAQARAGSKNLDPPITFRYMDAALVGESFPPASFDLIVSSLVFSELPPEDQRYVLEACAGLLAPGGRILIADEVVPSAPLAKLLYYPLRWTLALLTWLLTRATTNALHGFEGRLAESGLQGRPAAAYLGGSLVLYEIQPATALQPEAGATPPAVGILYHQVTWRTLLIDLWALFFRIVPPYPKVKPGLYAVGHPGPDAPVLVTGNFDLTVRRLVREIDGRVDAWVLVADSNGINVWCAAGGGYFTAEKVIAALKSSRLDQVVRHHALILPQLCANGVDGWRIRRATGWGVFWGPVQAKDVPAYLQARRKKTDRMRWVRFPLRDRLEMVTVTLGFYALLILLPVWLFWRQIFWPVAASLLGLSYFYAAVHPWLPGRDGLYKSIPLALIALAGLFIYSTVWGPLPRMTQFHWAVGLTGLSIFVAAEMQGMSPKMRGEQANWGWEALIGAVLGLVYWLFPLLAGWR